MVHVMVCKQPSADELRNIGQWGSDLEKAWRHVMVVPEAVKYFCRVQPSKLQRLGSFYRLRSEGRERSNERHNGFFTRSPQFSLCPKTGISGDMMVMMRARQMWEMWADEEVDYIPFDDSP